MSSGGAGSRVSIPNNVRQTIDHIREITGKQHTDEDIYTVLKECSMDPNETTQKLLFLDTFHVVERKSRKKEILNNKAPEDSRLSSNTQGRGTRAVRGNYSSQHVSSDAGAGRNSAARRVNGVGHRTERGPISSSSVILQKPKNNAAPHFPKPTNEIPNGLTNLSNGSSDPVHASQSGVGVIEALKDGPNDENKDTVPLVHSDAAEQLPSKNIPTFGSVIGVDLPKSATSSDPHHSGSSSYAPDVYSSASDPALVPTVSSQHQSAVGSQQIVSEPNNNQVDKHLPDNLSDPDLSKTKSENVPVGAINRNIPSKLNAEVKDQVHEPPRSSSMVIHDDPAAVRSSSIYNGQSPQESITHLTEAAPENAESSPQSLINSNVSVGQHVTFPNHFQVPEALRSGLTFGSFDPTFGPAIKSNGPASDNNSVLTVESSRDSDEISKKHSSTLSVTSTEHKVDYPDHMRRPPSVLENGPSEDNVASVVLPEHEQVKQDILLHSGGPQNPVIQNAVNYSLGVMQQMPGEGGQFEAPEPQARDVPPLPNLVGGNSPAISTPSSSLTPPVTQTAAAAQNTVPISAHPFPLFRQPYPPNYFPYGPYFSPFFVPQMHQFLGPNGFPQQPSPGNMYLPPAAAGVKYSVPQLKAGLNPGTPAHIGLPPGYGSYNSSHVGYGPSPAVSSGSSTGGEDFAASQQKENHIYTTAGQSSEGPTVWYSTPGQDVSCLYNLPLQGQHVTYSPVHPGHGTYAGIYQPPQTIAAPSVALPLMQQSQATTNSIETPGPPPQPGVYQQQPQHAQMNWNANF